MAVDTSALCRKMWTEKVTLLWLLNKESEKPVENPLP